MTNFSRQFRGIAILVIMYLAGAASVFCADYVPGELYVKYVSSAARIAGDSPEAVIAQMGGFDIRQAFPAAERLVAKKGSPEQMMRRASLASIRRVHFPENTDMALIARKLSALPSIEYAEPVWINHTCAVPNDPEYSAQDYFALVNAPSAWNVATGDTTVVIAIVDTAIDWQHTDLAANVWTNPNEIAGNEYDDDDNGVIDDVHGADLSDDDGDPYPISNAHGTHVAGIAAAVTNNALGVASLSHNVHFMPVKAGDGINNEIYYGLDGILYSADAGADIINCSWGSNYNSNVLREIVETVTGEGILIIASAGNDETDIPFYPAAYPTVLSVGAITPDKIRSEYSNHGATVDIAAPGNNIYSTLLTDQYGFLSGTSMSAPIVSALAALIMSHNPAFDSDQVKAQIFGTAKQLAFQEYLMGEGYIDAGAALGQAQKYVTLQEIAFSDATPYGNNDGIFRPGEILTASLIVRNLGMASTTVTLTAESLNSCLKPLFSTISVGPLDHAEEVQTIDVQFEVNDDVSVDAQEIVQITISADGSPSTSNVALRINPSFSTFTANTLELSFNSKGNIGYADYPTNLHGTGFVIRRTDITDESMTEVPLLFEGGFMIGAGPDHVSDVVRSDIVEYNTVPQDTDLSATSMVTIQTDSGDGSETGYAVFNDSGAGADAYGVTVDFTGYAYSDESVDQCLILTYTIQNTGQQNLTGMRAGLFFDFDVPEWSPHDDLVYYDDENDIIAIEADTTERLGKVIAGVAALPEISSPWLIDNGYDGDVSVEPYFGLYDGFSEAEKWQSLSAGNIAITYIGNTDISVVAAAPAFDLQPGESHEIAFVIGYGIGYDDLKLQLENGKARAADIITMVEESDHHQKPSAFGIVSAYPNPFNPATTIEIASPSETQAAVAVYAITGQKIRTLINGTIDAGYSTVQWDGCDDNGMQSAAGVYLIRFSTDISSSVHRVTLLK